MGSPLYQFTADIGVQFNFTVTSNFPTPILQSATKVELLVQRASNSPFLCTIDNALLGACHYTSLVGDFSLTGLKDAQLRITMSGGAIYHTEKFSFDVLAPVI